MPVACATSAARDAENADEAAAAEWKRVAEHLVAQERGATTWYADYRVRVATVTRDYGKASRPQPPK